jgi:hypothetical protein
MADLAVPKKGQGPAKQHPMQEHLDNIKKSHDEMDKYFRGQMESQFEAEADQDRQAKRPTREIGGVKYLGEE